VTRTSLPAAINEVAARDPVLAHLVALVGPITYRPRNPDGPFGALVRSIIYQQLAGRAAQAIDQRVRSTVGGTVTLETLTAVPDDALRAAGLSANKLASLSDLSAKILDGTSHMGPRTFVCTSRSYPLPGSSRQVRALPGFLPASRMDGQPRRSGSRIARFTSRWGFR